MQSKIIQRGTQIIGESLPAIENAILGTGVIAGITSQLTEDIGQESWNEHLLKTALEGQHSHQQTQNQEQMSQGRGRTSNWASWQEEEKKQNEEEKGNWDDWQQEQEQPMFEDEPIQSFAIIPQSRGNPPMGSGQAIEQTLEQPIDQIIQPPPETQEHTDQSQWKKFLLTYFTVEQLANKGPEAIKKIWDIYWEWNASRDKGFTPYTNDFINRIKDTPIPSHCRRVIFVNEYGVPDSMVICRDEQGNDIVYKHK